MLDRRSNTIAAILVGLMSLAGAWVLLQVPPTAPIAIHFDAAGRPNGWAPAWIGMFGLPLLSAAVWGILMLLPRIDPRGENLKRSGRAMGAIGLATLVVLTIGQFVIAAPWSSWPTAAPRPTARRRQSCVLRTGTGRAPAGP
ncbi:DUF1648 domain-containing protein [Massilia arenosa]|uniref:DUF1648 domain-containing protein n=1 Tax=Zemynaea arenosa TaxID=2561931 RepID=A0A4Y9S4Q2_9BURK|nr:DUF1648 domain-containing protein [Massilia arenosa]TFW15006.1 DUF1648 domain-containing protein [Massilia arenosa]